MSLDQRRPTRLSALVTCHNRRAKTLACLSSLREQRALPAGLDVEVVLVDAGSSDGTAEDVRLHHPDAEIVETTANVYWGEGMRMAASAALRRGHDGYLLWLNDDVVLEPEAISALLALHASVPSPCIVTGSLVDERGRQSYGGLMRAGASLRFARPGVTDDAISCDTMNGNAVLMRAETYLALGGIDARFPHAMGDVDFGLRATSAGIRVIQVPGVTGHCEPNPKHQNVDRASLRKRLRWAGDVKQFPVRAWWTFCRRHGGRRFPRPFLAPYIRALLNRQERERERTAQGREQGSLP